MVDTYKSSSFEQQNAETYVASMVEGWLGCQMERNAKFVTIDSERICMEYKADRETF